MEQPGNNIFESSIKSICTICNVSEECQKMVLSLMHSAWINLSNRTAEPKQPPANQKTSEKGRNNMTVEEAEAEYIKSHSEDMRKKETICFEYFRRKKNC